MFRKALKYRDAVVYYLLRNSGVLFIFLFAITACLSFIIGKDHYKSKEKLCQKMLAWEGLKKKVILHKEVFGQDTAVVIKDLSDEWEIAVNADKTFPSASMVKIPIMASFICAGAQGRLSLSERVILKNRYKVPGSGILKTYAEGTSLSLEQLIELMIAQSDNTAANMLIDYIGFDYLNSSFKKLGLADTNIARKMMDFKKRRSGTENFTTAQDLAYILETIYRNRLVDEKLSQKCIGILKKQKVRDRIPAKLPSDAVVANKTGLENGVCHDAGIVFTSRGDFIICVLTRHNHKTSRPAKRFISQIALDAYNFYLCKSQ